MSGPEPVRTRPEHGTSRPQALTRAAIDALALALQLPTGDLDDPDLPATYDDAIRVAGAALHIAATHGKDFLT